VRSPALSPRALRIVAWCELARSTEVSDASWSGGGFWANAAFILAVFPFPLTGILIVTRRPSEGER
jgi:hypothetical protein